MAKFISKASYSIDDMSDDEDNQPRQMAPQQHQQMQPQRQGGPVLTQDYLASVLASIRNQPMAAQPSQLTQQAAPVPAAQPTPAAQPQISSGMTRDYFQNVMQQMFNPPSAVQPPQQSTLSTTTQSRPVEAAAPQTNNSDAELASKMEQMHELGLFDDQLNLRALQVTEGNVDAAVSLIMEGGL